MQSLKYKKYVLMILTSVYVSCLLSVLWVFTGYFAPRLETAWVDEIYKLKESYARAIKSPKIVIVSGSSGLFGISAAQMENHFNIPTLNLSTHADLMDYYFHRAKQNIQPGDLVILTPEYQLYFFDEPLKGIKGDYIVNFDKAYFRALPFVEMLSLLQTYAHPWKMLKNEISYFRDIFRKQRRTGGYDARDLNRNGDETSNIGTKEQQYKPVFIPKKFNPDTYVLKKISAFIQWCQKNNITVMLTWPGTLAPQSEIYQNQIFFHNLIVFLSNAGAVILGEPQDFFVPATYLYDSIYHLNTEGVAGRTAKLISLLEQNQCFSDWKASNNGIFEAPPLVTPTLEMHNICYNGDMEQSADKGVSGWKAIIGEKENPFGIAQWDGSTAHSGKYALKLINTSGQQIRWRGEKVSMPPDTRSIQVSAWSKANDILDKAVYCVSLKVYFENGSFKWDTRGLHFSKGTHDWEEVKSVLDFDEEVTAVEPFLILYSTTGTAWFDDIDICMHANR